MTIEYKQRPPKWPRVERALSILLAFIWMLWAIDAALLGLESKSFVYFLFFALHILFAILYFVRKSPRVYPDKFYSYLVALASTFYVFAYYPNSETVGCTVLSIILLLAGGGIAFTGAVSLGKSFGIRPVLRDVRTGGLYRIIRHPIYAGYMVMDLGEVVGHPSLRNFGVAIVGAGFFLWRSKIEEQVLKVDPEYVVYMRRVPRRFFPRII